MAKIIERVEAHYEAQEVEFGRVYKWRSESVLVECEECGEKTILTDSETTCECGADHAATVPEELPVRRLGDEDLHPWRYAGDRADAGIAY